MSTNNENSARIALERSIVRKVIRAVVKAGYRPAQVWDGGEYVKTPTERSALEAIFSVDDATLHFEHTDPAARALCKYSHGVYFVGGNGCDIVSDYHCGDPIFSAAIDAVSDEVCS